MILMGSETCDGLWLKGRLGKAGMVLRLDDGNFCVGEEKKICQCSLYIYELEHFVKYWRFESG